MLELIGRITAVGAISGELQTDLCLVGTVDRPQGYAEYTGSYNVEPIDGVQTLQTAGKVMARDLVIAPIPGDWGRITRDGNALRII